jgi:hypothetical protein
VLLGLQPISALHAATAAEVISRLARPVPAVTAFREVRFSHLLKTPLVVAGELEFRGSGRMSRRVSQPFREATEIEGDQVSVQRSGKARKFSLQRAPELQGLLGAFGALLEGKAVELQQQFALQLTENAAGWDISLRPIDSRVARRLERIQIVGAANEPHCLSLIEPDGDVSVLILGPLAARPLPMPMQRKALGEFCLRG